MNTLRTFREGISNGLRMRGEYVYVGTINRPLRLLVVCRNAANGLLIMQRPPTKCVANIPPGVGADSSRPCPNITKYTYSFHHTRILTSSNTHIHFTAHVFMFHRTCISVSHFVGVFIYVGTMNLPLRLLTVCDNAANGLLIMLRSPTKCATNTLYLVGE